jgi:hypothetical protein
MVFGRTLPQSVDAMTTHTSFPSPFLLVSARVATFLLVSLWLTGCASLKSGSEESTFSISALEGELQEAGVFVMPRGDAGVGVPAEQSAILLLNSSESLTVYEFASAAAASDQAHLFAGANPRRDVYLKDRVVAIRRSTGDTGLAQTLRDILGEAL